MVKQWLALLRHRMKVPKKEGKKKVSHGTSSTKIRIETVFKWFLTSRDPKSS